MKIVKPQRAERSYTQQLVAGPQAVLPLLCPVREADWIDGWDPLLVVSASGLRARLHLHDRCEPGRRHLVHHLP